MEDEPKIRGSFSKVDRHQKNFTVFVTLAAGVVNRARPLEKVLVGCSPDPVGPAQERNPHSGPHWEHLLG